MLNKWRKVSVREQEIIEKAVDSFLKKLNRRGDFVALAVIGRRGYKGELTCTCGGLVGNLEDLDGVVRAAVRYGMDRASSEELKPDYTTFERPQEECQEEGKK